MNRKYTIGIDFGTLSGRAVIVDVSTGDIVAQGVKYYTHAVMDKQLPDGTELQGDWALQHPNDYIEVLEETIPQMIRKSGLKKEQIIGIGTDFTASTFLPIKKDGTPLCMLPELKNRPHAYVKLWKHHAARRQADRLNEIASEMGEIWLNRYGGKISSEWQVPKVMQIIEEAPEVYEQADLFIEAADWIIMALCGKAVKNKCTAGYKGLWHYEDAYPSKVFFRLLHPALENYVEEKLSYPLADLGKCIGTITANMAKKLGLSESTAIATGNVDAHVSLPAMGITEPEKMLMIMGTSTCDILLGTEEKLVSGMCGVVRDGVLPGFFGYEAGQSCVGDHFQWMVENCASSDVMRKAEKAGKGIHDYLTQRAENLKAGESGLLALDWWNGNRSVLIDADLTGLMLGMSLKTKPEEIYRALIEATAFGKRKIIETLESAGVPINELYACGGIAWKNKLMMQIYADVTGKTIKVSDCAQTPALGSAIFAAVAAGKKRGGYNSINDAVKAMRWESQTCYTANPKNKMQYDKLYHEYDILYDHFGRGGNDVMKRLKKIKAEV